MTGGLNNTLVYNLFRYKLSIALLFISFTSLAQNNDSSTTIRKGPLVSYSSKKNQNSFPDSIFKFNTKTPLPKRAGLYSALIPGVGQIYNRQYIKAGLVYVAAGVAAGFIITYNNKYQYYQKVYLGRIDSDPATTDTITIYSTEDINTLRQGYRKYTEYAALAGTACYLINILDAYISAHLKTFDMSKDISFRAMPALNDRKQIGIKLSFAFN